MKIETRAREVSSLSEIIANRKTVRAYFRGLKAWEPPAPPEPDPPALEPEQPRRIFPTIPRRMRDRIVDAVCDYYEVPRWQLTMPGKIERPMLARRIASYILSIRAGLSYPQVGNILCRDHSTIIHAVNCVERDMRDNPAIAAEIAEIMEQVG